MLYYKREEYERFIPQHVKWSIAFTYTTLVVVLPLVVYTVVKVPDARATLAVILTPFAVNAGIVTAGVVWRWLCN